MSIETTRISNPLTEEQIKSLFLLGLLSAATTEVLESYEMLSLHASQCQPYARVTFEGFSVRLEETVVDDENIYVLTLAHDSGTMLATELEPEKIYDITLEMVIDEFEIIL